MTRPRAALVAGALGLLIGAPAAGAHPLGNFSVNHEVRVSISRDRIDLHYILDQAEIPTFQERGLPAARVLARKQAEVRRALVLSVDGRNVAWQFAPGSVISHPPGQGGLPLTRAELLIVAVVHARARVEVSDGTFPDRVGWKAIVALSGHGTAVRSSVPATDPTRGLQVYPVDTLASPLDERTAIFAVAPGNGSVQAPSSRYGGPAATTNNRAGDGFAGVFAQAAAGRGVLVLLLFAAFAWGAIHALSPGHGKTMVAAYLVGTRGTARHALALGATVTVAHTVGVFALGLVTLLLAQYILPEQLYPWLNLASGLLVVAIGAGVLGSRLRWRSRRGPIRSPDDRTDVADAAHAPAGHHHQRVHEDLGERGRHDQAAHGHTHPHGHEHRRPGHDHQHGHHHHPPDHITAKALVGMGVSAGALPCPSALVVLLAALTEHQLALGLLLITFFSLGLATTLSVLGLLVISAKRVLSRVPVSSAFTAAVPAASTLFIVGIGVMLTARALPRVI